VDDRLARFIDKRVAKGRKFADLALRTAREKVHRRRLRQIRRQLGALERRVQAAATITETCRNTLTHLIDDVLVP
jgi:hypothetical protein